MNMRNMHVLSRETFGSSSPCHWPSFFSQSSANLLRSPMNVYLIYIATARFSHLRCSLAK